MKKLIRLAKALLRVDREGVPEPDFPGNATHRNLWLESQVREAEFKRRLEEELACERDIHPLVLKYYGKKAR